MTILLSLVDCACHHEIQVAYHFQDIHIFEQGDYTAQLDLFSLDKTSLLNINKSNKSKTLIKKKLPKRKFILLIKYQKEGPMYFMKINGKYFELLIDTGADIYVISLNQKSDTWIIIPIPTSSIDLLSLQCVS